MVEVKENGGLLQGQKGKLLSMFWIESGIDIDMV